MYTYDLRDILFFFNNHLTILIFNLLSVFATMLLDHLLATNLNMFTHLLTNKETFISIDYLELSITYLQLT